MRQQRARGSVAANNKSAPWPIGSRRFSLVPLCGILGIKQ
jgi:hypothetical protein